MRIIINEDAFQDSIVNGGLNQSDTIEITDAEWRPDNWAFPYGDPWLAGEGCVCELCTLSKAYEAGATAMLKALDGLKEAE